MVHYEALFLSPPKCSPILRLPKPRQNKSVFQTLDANRRVCKVVGGQSLEGFPKTTIPERRESFKGPHNQVYSYCLDSL